MLGSVFVSESEELLGCRRVHYHGRRLGERFVSFNVNGMQVYWIFPGISVLWSRVSFKPSADCPVLLVAVCHWEAIDVFRRF